MSDTLTITQPDDLVSGEPVREPSELSERYIKSAPLFLQNYIKAYGVISWAAELTGISAQTAYNWKNKYPEFDADLKALDAEVADQVERLMIEKDLSAEANFQARKFWLARRNQKYKVEAEPLGDGKGEGIRIFLPPQD